MKKTSNIFKLALPALLAIAGIAFAGCGGGTPAQDQGQSISVGGSTSVTPLMEQFLGAFNQLHPDITITVSGTGSGDGIRGAGDGIHDIGMSSRALAPAELGLGLNPTVVAIDGIALVLHNASPISNLTMQQVRDIYTGAITNWEQLGEAANGKSGGIAVISREPGSGTRGAFQEIIEFSDAQLAVHANILDGQGAVRAGVAGNPSAIGYISIGAVDGSVRAVSIGGYAPTEENIRAGSYAIARPFILITRHGHTPSPAAQSFLDWVLSDAGQAIVGINYVRVN
ncbi:MAG: phosphate ABC transporter substrate-binding protein [Spirochaetes bacterium]|nr:phosphate ABC transporter substrate-binding protein [Spirochaetota bacterium]